MSFCCVALSMKGGTVDTSIRELLGTKSVPYLLREERERRGGENRRKSNPRRIHVPIYQQVLKRQCFTSMNHQAVVLATKSLVTLFNKAIHRVDGSGKTANRA